MIKERTPIAAYKVKNMLEDLKETDKSKDMKIFLKKFSNLSEAKSEKLEADLRSMDLIKLREADIIKIVDIAPENAAELNKILIDASLDADETNKILETIKSNR